MNIKLQCSRVGDYEDAYFIRLDIGEKARDIGWQGDFTQEKVGEVLKELEEWAQTI